MIDIMSAALISQLATQRAGGSTSSGEGNLNRIAKVHLFEAPEFVPDRSGPTRHNEATGAGFFRRYFVPGALRGTPG